MLKKEGIDKQNSHASDHPLEKINGGNTQVWDITDEAVHTLIIT
ncbi:hypothetical protein SAMN05877753_102659 [Bacillus oleivorans]|uniref:Uncharacterized protein n=1 Tax=Bacillus oleivorans TaxID=1448271 RepID=A0A285CNX4_9BACI|nr:hypothetical protein SAMN05877753_102659 [Bacillus oleivorans]